MRAHVDVLPRRNRHWAHLVEENERPDHLVRVAGQDAADREAAAKISWLTF
jgi:hypothetical protein